MNIKSNAEKTTLIAGNKRHHMTLDKNTDNNWQQSKPVTIDIWVNKPSGEFLLSLSLFNSNGTYS